MYKIMIVDDEQLLRQGFIHMTDWFANGYKIVGEASNGVEALEIIKTNHPDIVVTDVRMPSMDGIELTRLIKESYPDIEVIILSSYSDFEYVRETLKLGSFDYILKQKMKSKDLLDVMDKLKPRIDKAKARKNTISDFDPYRRIEAFYKSLCMDKNLDSRYIAQSIDKYEISLAQHDLRAVMIDFQVAECEKTSKLQYSDDLSRFIQYVFSNNLPGVENLYSFQLNQNTIIFLFNCTSRDKTTLKSSLLNSKSMVDKKYPVDLAILVTDLFEGYKNISINMDNLISVRPYTFYVGKNTLMFADDYQHTVTTLNYDLHQLDKQLSVFDFDDIKRKLSDLINVHCDRLQYIEPYSLKKSFILLYHHIIIKITGYGYDLSIIDRKKFELFKKIEDSESLKELLDVFSNILDTIHDYIMNHQMNYSNVIREIMKYLNENYNSDISLSSLAKLFHMNRNYLCEYFKQQTGKNFIDCLLNIRINKAKELLLLPDHHINDICYEVGFSNPSYFAKVFKSVTNMTPSEYIRCQRISRI